MAKFMEVVQWILANYQLIITAVVGVCSSLIVLFALIPGKQPEAFLQKVVDFIGKFSKK